MEKLVQPNELRPRIQLWVEEQVRFKRINQKAGLLLDAILYRGEVPRGDVAQILGLSTRYSRDTVTQLTQQGVIASDTPYGPSHRFHREAGATLDAWSLSRGATLVRIQDGPSS